MSRIIAQKVLWNTASRQRMSFGGGIRSAIGSSNSSSVNVGSSSSTNRSFGSHADWHGTTIVCVRKNGQVTMMGDGQVSMGSMMVKPNAKKIRRISSKNENAKDTIVGFAGSTADAFTLLERLEGKLDEYPGQLARSCVELAKGWRTDKYLRRLEASLLVADDTVSLELTGNGDVLESHDGVLGIGSGSAYAIAAARALKDIDDLSSEDVAKRSMEIASDMCVYTNKSFMIETMGTVEEETKDETK
jgi:ATP-dependent HslUV protease subunit HslV